MRPGPMIPRFQHLHLHPESITREQTLGSKEVSDRRLGGKSVEV